MTLLTKLGTTGIILCFCFQNSYSFNKLSKNIQKPLKHYFAPKTRATEIKYLIKRINEITQKFSWPNDAIPNFSLKEISCEKYPEMNLEKREIGFPVNTVTDTYCDCEVEHILAHEIAHYQQYLEGKYNFHVNSICYINKLVEKIENIKKIIKEESLKTPSQNKLEEIINLLLLLKNGINLEYNKIIYLYNLKHHQYSLLNNYKLRKLEFDADKRAIIALNNVYGLFEDMRNSEIYKEEKEKNMIREIFSNNKLNSQAYKFLSYNKYWLLRNFLEFLIKKYLKIKQTLNKPFSTHPTDESRVAQAEKIGIELGLPLTKPQMKNSRHDIYGFYSHKLRI